MKKFTLIALLCALFIGADLKAQEVTYVEDPTQGYLMNRFKDNWFISGEIGGGVLMSNYDTNLGFGKRIMPSFNISVGKWFSPIIGLRISADFRKQKGMTYEGTGIHPITPNDGAENGYLVNRQWFIGPSADVLINVTNWWCGYKPGRVYNAVLYAGFAGHAAMVQKDVDNEA